MAWMTPEAARATIRSPSPSRSTAWWWRPLTAMVSGPVTAARRDPAVDGDPFARQEALGFGDLGVEVTQFLMKGAPPDHVQELGPPADAEHRQVALQRLSDEAPFEGVPHRGRRRASA
jgi:hypothetical protein